MQRHYSSSSQWFARQARDPYVRAARDANYRSRAAFKLIQVDEKYSLFKGANLVVDLGATPGGWSQVASSRIGRNGQSSPNGVVIAIDMLEMDPLPNVQFVRGDFTLPQSLASISEICNGRAIDVILSY
jgi:23S rRNA (uridine2552-2'-O)-methyltransferase